MKKILLSILILIIYINSNGQSPLRINKYLIDSLVSGTWYIYHDSTHTGQWGQLGSGGGGGGSGTVTSVSFTGGLISVANPTTTPALTVAGTSGGIPYFSSTSTWASSGLLAANALMIGGGAGAAPTTTTTGTGVLTALGINVGSAGAFVTFNGAGGTPSSITLTNGTGLLASGITLTDNTTNNVTNAAHGFFPKLTSNTVYYVDNAGALVALALGSSGQVLTSNGATSAPTFETPTGGSSTWNGITNPTGDQALTFDAGESSTWTDQNTTEDLFTVNNATSTTNSLFSYNRTSTALASGNNILELVSSGANGTNAITATALRVSVTNTNGTSGTNVGLDVTASGATTANIAARFTGLVGITEQTPQTQLQVGEDGGASSAFGTAAQMLVTNNGAPAYSTILGPTSTEMFMGAESGIGIIGTVSNHKVSIRTNNTLRMDISNAGVVTIANLAGTGSRNVLADDNGVLSAPVSDFSVKKNIQSLGYGLNTIMQLKPVSFEYIDGWKNYGKGTQLGFIAQDVNKVLPNSTFITPTTGKMGYNSQDMIPVLVKAVQEQQEEIEELKNEIKRLKK